MKNSYLFIVRILSFVLFLLLTGFLLYIYNMDINLLEISGNNKNNFYPYIRVSIATILPLLALLTLKKVYNIYYFLNLIWLIPLFVIFIKVFFGSYATEKLDYFMGKTIDNYSLRKYENRGWIINEITIKHSNKVDSIYVSVNPSWESKSYQLNDKKKSKIVRSWITGYYYVTVK